ncbi:MAG: hypothetical protein H7838_08450 [Magnetococcus sp. DMHC-8]
MAMVRREPEWIVPGEVAFIAHALVVPSREEADREAFDADTEKVAMELTRAHEDWTLDKPAPATSGTTLPR